MDYLGSARLKHAVHRSAQGSIDLAARAGLDLGARMVPFAGDAAARAASFTSLEAAADVTVRPPIAAFDDAGTEYRTRWTRVARGYDLDAAGILDLRDARFHVPGGIVAVGGRFPREAMPLSGFPHTWQVADAVRTLWGPARRAPDGYLLGLPMAGSYYHWVAETLPLALLIERHDPAGTSPILLGADLPGFVMEYLRIIGLSDRCVELRRGVHRSGHLRVPTFPGGAEWPAPGHLQAVRERVLGALGVTPEPRRRLIVSRGDALDRRVVNEAELVGALAPLGFELVTLGGVSAEAQVRLFAQAEVVVAPHGAGTTNMLFAPGDCGLVELIGGSHCATCFMVLASAVGQPYGYVQCHETQRQLTVDVARVRDAVAAVTPAVTV